MAGAHRAAEAPAGWWLLALGHLTQRASALCPERRAGDSLAELDSLVESAATLPAPAQRTAASGTHSESALMRAALRGAGTFVWEWDVASGVLPDFGEGLALLGYPRTQPGRTQEDWNALIHADDRDANHEAYLRHERGKAEQYKPVYRARTHDGQWRWLHERGRTVERSVDGRPRRMLGSQADITRQHELEDSYSQANRRLQRIASHVPGVLYQFMSSADGERAWFTFVGARCGTAAHGRSRLARSLDFEPAQLRARRLAVAAGVSDPAARRRIALAARRGLAAGRGPGRNGLVRLHRRDHRPARTRGRPPRQGHRRSLEPRHDGVPLAHEP